MDEFLLKQKTEGDIWNGYVIKEKKKQLKVYGDT